MHTQNDLPAAAVPATNHSRPIALSGASNFRDLGGYKGLDGRSLQWRKLYRSAHLAHLTAEDLARLRSLGVTRSADFRGLGESQHLSYAWPHIERHALVVEPTVVQRAQSMLGQGRALTARDTEELMPLPITLAHRLSKQLADVRKAGITNSLLPDGKTQVTVRYEGDKPVHIDAIVVSTQHYEHYELEEVREEVKKNVIVPVLDDSLFTDKTRVLINPTGRFVVGGPQGDTGLTGRKIICDTYGGFGHHGGGAFSGKDPTKVDRTASYAARYIAKNLVAAGLCSQCEVQLAYAIGVAQPVSLTISSFGSGTLDDGEMEALVRRGIDLRPAALIERFDMLRPIYQQVSNYGHFGRPDLDLPWEQLDSAKKWA